jgi:LmbE family N-acetylglucosaminyl deacetylase
VVSFDAHVAVTSPDAWDGLAQWAGVPALDSAELRQVDELVVFSAHADDETLGAGGLLARLARTAITVRIVVATGDTDRASELRGALLALGVDAEVEFLGLVDGGLKHESERLRREIDRVLGRSGARSLTLAPWPGDRHGDHRTLGRDVSDAARTTDTRLLFYPVWLWQWGTPEDVPWKRLVDVELTEGERDAKAAAIGCFTSQLASPSNPAGVLSPEFIRHVSSKPEVLIRPEWAQLDAHFEQLHRNVDDPWSVRTRWYERRKRELIVATLPRERYERALELGCSIGETTAALATRCDEVIAVDHSAAAVASATRRLTDVSRATVARMRIPDDWPDGTFDLIVVSEIGYYLAEDQWARTIDRCRSSLRADGEVLLCHWLGQSDDFAQTGMDVHTAFRRHSGLAAMVEHREPEFILEVFA